MEKNVLLKLQVRKSKNGNFYTCLVADVGWKEEIVTFDVAKIAIILDLSMQDLYGKIQELQVEYEKGAK